MREFVMVVAVRPLGGGVDEASAGPAHVGGALNRSRGGQLTWVAPVSVADAGPYG